MPVLIHKDLTTEGGPYFWHPLECLLHLTIEAVSYVIIPMQ